MNRFAWSAFILLFIIFYSIDLPISSGTLNLGMLFLATGCYWSVRNEKRKSLLMCMLLTWLLSAMYAGFSLWVMYDPIILIVPKEWMSASIISLAAILVVKKARLRLITAILGLIHGEVLSFFVYQQIWGYYEIGHGAFFDVIATVCLVLVIYRSLQLALLFFEKLVKNNHQTSQTL